MNLRTAVFFFILSFLVFSCESVPMEDTSNIRHSDYDKAESHYKLGIASFNRGNIITAKKELSLAIKYNPDLPYYYNHLGLIYMKDADLTRAEGLFLKAYDMDNSYTDPLNNLGALYTEKGEYKKARKDLLKAFSDPIYPYPHNVALNLGNLEYKEKNYDAAEKYYKKSLKIKKNYCQAFVSLGNLYDVENRDEDALLNYVSAVNNCPFYIEALYKGAIKFLLQKNEKKAKKFLAQCVKFSEESSTDFEVPFLKECVSLAKKYDLKNIYNNKKNEKREINGL